MTEKDIKKLHYTKGAFKRALKVKSDAPGSLITASHNPPKKKGRRQIAIRGLV